MIMIKKKITLQEGGLEIRDGKSMILKIINNHIKEHKIKLFSHWETEDHSVLSAQNHEMEKLENIKDEIQELLSKINQSDGDLNFKVNLEVEISDASSDSVKPATRVAS